MTTETAEKPFPKTLPVRISDHEKLQYGQTLARERKSITVAEDEKKEAMAGFKARIEGHVYETGRLAEIIDSGIEYRDVDCSLEFDSRTGQARTIRLDTGEVVHTRRMTTEEYQTQMDFAAS